MFTKVIRWALWLTPFVIWQGQDIRELKLAFCLLACLSITLIALYEGQFKPVRNKYALFFIGFLWLSTMLAPSPGVSVMGMHIGTYWAYKCLIYIFAAFTAICAIASHPFTKDEIQSILKTICLIGTVIGTYTIIQSFGIEQFFKSNGQHHEQWNIVGTFGHSNFIGSFLAMIVPIGIVLKRYKSALLIFVAVCITQSMVAIGAMVVSLLILTYFKNKKTLIPLIIIVAALTAILFSLQPHYPAVISSSGRFVHTPKIINEVLFKNFTPDDEGRFPFTGLGLGSFYYTYHVVHNNRFYQAHNEYLELFYNCGLIGIGLFLLAIWQMLKDNWNKGWLKNCVMASFICIAINAGGLFVWQLGSHILFSVVIVGLLNNKELENG